MTQISLSEEDIFQVARRIGRGEARAAYLNQACGEDVVLREEVEELLRAHDESQSFLESPASEIERDPGSLATLDHCPPEKLGTLIGPYKLLEQIGEGGMGVVFVAEQTEPVRRRVALKIIKPGMDSKQVIARFEAERQALAMMDHPNIAKILDAGMTGEEGPGTSSQEPTMSPSLAPGSRPLAPSARPYFVMELVRGMPITDYCDKVRLGPRRRLELFVDVCHAIQHAHQKGIIHRDLKPSNVLITLHDGKPVVKVIDFGVAKAVGQQLTERTIYTALTQLVGTPLYMSPEQAEMSGLDVDTRSDVYSLGVLLYELLTGQTPFDKEALSKAGFDEMRRMIREAEPPRPSRRLSTLGAQVISTASQHRGVDERRLSKILSGELDWIVMKALEKDRSRRYESASALAADIQRYLSDEPVLACPPTTMYRFQKFARKHRPALVTAAAIALCLLLGTTVSAWQAVRATTAEAQANANEAQAQASAQEAKLRAQEANTERDEAQRQRDEVKGLNDKLAAKEQQLQRNLYTSNMNLARHAWEEGGIERVKQLLAQHQPKPGETDLRGFEWHYLNRLCHSELLTLKGHTAPVIGVIYSPDGKRLASTSNDQTVKVWDAQTGQELLTLKGHARDVTSVAYSPDGKRLASASMYDTVKVWDAHTGQEVLSLKAHVYGGNGVSFSPDGKRVASGAYTYEEKADKSEYSVKVWDAETGQELLICKGHTELLWSVAFSPDGKRLASAAEDSTVRLWDAQTGQELMSLKGHTGAVTSVAFSPDGKRLAGIANEMVMVWDAQTGEKVHALQNSGSSSVAFSPDGQRLVADTGDGSLRIWDLKTTKELRTIKGGGGAQWQTAFSPDGRRVAGTAGDNTVKIWDAQKDQENFTLQGVGGAGVELSLSPDFRRVASGSWDGTVKIWDAQTGQQTFNLKGHTASISSVAFSPDGKRLASGGGGRKLPAGSHSTGLRDRAEVKVWDTQTGQELRSLSVPESPGAVFCVAFSPDGKRLASGENENKDGKVGYPVKVWDIETGQELLTIAAPGGVISSVAFSPDGKCLASSYHVKNWVKVWDAKTGQELLSLPDGGQYVAYSPDGKRLASGSKVWDAQTGQKLVTLQGGGGKLVFSPDGKRLVCGPKVWDAETGQELLSLKGAGQAVAFSPGGHRLATKAPDGTVKIYDASPLPEKP